MRFWKKFLVTGSALAWGLVVQILEFWLEGKFLTELLIVFFLTGLVIDSARNQWFDPVIEKAEWLLFRKQYYRFRRRRR